MTNRQKQLRLALRGFGEAGSAFASGWNRAGLASISAYDEKIQIAAERPALEARLAEHNVAGCEDAASAYTNADIVLSLVFADRAFDAATDTAKYLRAKTFYVDGNSCSPQTKQRSAEALEPMGINYIDMAVMAPVYPKREKTPVLLAGPQAEQASLILAELGMLPRVVGDKVGAASAIKLTRSIMIKGMEALFAECFLAARLGGVEDEVIASFEASDPDINWKHRRDYAMDRMTIHGRRRAAEMVEAAHMVAELGLPNDMARSTAKWEQLMGNLPVQANNVDDVLKAMGKA